MKVAKIIISSFVFVIILCTILLFLYYKYIEMPLHPTQPVASGEFNAQPVWVYAAEETITSTPAVKGLRIFIRTLNSIFALDATNGNLLWHVVSPGTYPLSVPPQVIDEYLIVPEKGSQIAAFTIDTGHLVWRTSPIRIALDNPVTAAIESITSMNDMIYVARFDWSLIAYNLKNGGVAWEQNIPGRTSPYLAADERAVYLGAGQSLKAYDVRTGAILWQEENEGYTGPIILDGNILYITNEAHPSLFALDLDTLNVKWKKEFPEINEFEFGCLLASDTTLYIAAEELIAVSKTDGRVVWISEKTGRLECPVILGRRIYVRNTNTKLFAFEIGSGRVVGMLILQANTPMKHEPNRSPAVSGDMLIVPFGDNRIFAYKY